MTNLEKYTSLIHTVQLLQLPHIDKARSAQLILHVLFEVFTPEEYERFRTAMAAALNTARCFIPAKGDYSGSLHSSTTVAQYSIAFAAALEQSVLNTV